MKWAVVLGLSLLVSTASPLMADEPLVGRPVILEGDTLIIRGKVVGLFGVAAPGLRQTCWNKSGRTYSCGKIAAEALSEYVGEGVLRCEPRAADTHGRLIAICYKGGEDLSAWMVGQGFAVADRLRENAYIAAEQPAWAKKRGLWAGVFDDPTDRQRETYKPANAIVDAQPRGQAWAPTAATSKKH